MKILFVTPRLPLPADTGAKIRTFNLLKNAAKEHQVSLLTFEFGPGEKEILRSAKSLPQNDVENGNDRVNKIFEDLNKLGINTYLVKGDDKINPFKILGNLPLSIEKYRVKEMERKLKEILAKGKFDLIHFDHLHMGQYKKYVNGIPCVLDEHNVEAVILERCAEIEENPIKRILYRSQAKKMARFEGKFTQCFSRCLTVSETDKQNLYALSGRKANVEVIPNGVDTEYFCDEIASGASRPRNDTGETLTPRNDISNHRNVTSDSLVFTGSMDWLPNSDAVIYFIKEILPLIWAKNNSVKFYVVGRNPSKEVENLGNSDKRIIVTGLVEDVRPYILKAKVFVVPIRVGGGTRLKILEAMAMGKAVISTTVGAEGIAYTKDQDIILKDSSEEFADAVLMLLSNPDKINLLGEAGRKLVCEKYDWKIIGKKLNEVYKEVYIENK